MPEPRSPAIEPARAMWRDWLSTAQRLRQLTHERAGACEQLIASLQRWPSFAAADPWAINAQMPAGGAAAEEQGPAKRQRALRERWPPPPATRQTPVQRAGSAAAVSRLPPGLLSPPPRASQPLSALTRRAVDGRAVTESAGATHANAPVRGAAMDAMPSGGPRIAALVAETIGRYVTVTGTPAGGSVSSHALWSDGVPDAGEPASVAKAATTSPYAAPGESRPALQALDLPMRAALERVAQAEAPAPAAALLAPAGDLLQRLLPSANGGPSSTTAEPESTSMQRVAAPRAPSRLLSAPGHSASTPVATRRADGPLTDRSDEDGEDSADAISRQLADQAWLRGVDFT